MSLQKEQQTYLRELGKSLIQDGSFALIKDDSVLGVYDTYGDALTAGYEKCGLTCFMVKQVQMVERVQYFTRDIEACRT